MDQDRHLEQAGVERVGANDLPDRQGLRAGCPGLVQPVPRRRPGGQGPRLRGLEEVYETQNAGAGWNTVGPYWNFGFKCFAYVPFEGDLQPQPGALRPARCRHRRRQALCRQRRRRVRACPDRPQRRRLGEPQRAHGRPAVLRGAGQPRLDHLRRPAGQRQQQGVPDHGDRARRPRPADHGQLRAGVRRRWRLHPRRPRPTPRT